MTIITSFNEIKSAGNLKSKTFNLQTKGLKFDAQCKWLRLRVLEKRFETILRLGC